MVSQLFTSDMPTATQINTVFSVFITVPSFFVFGKDSNRSLLFNFRLTDKNDAIQNSQELSVCKRLKKTKQNKTSKGTKRGPRLIVPHHPTAGQSGRDNIMLCSKFESIHIL